MFPGMGGNPRQMAEIMRQLGMKSEEIKAEKVIIEKSDGSRLVVSEPQVVQIEMKGSKSFQVSGSVSEEGASEGVAGGSGNSKGGSQDVELVVSQTGASEEEARKALEEAEGDLAQAILLLKKE